VPANKTTAKNTKAKRATASKATAKKTTATKTKAKSTATKARSENATTRASDKAQPGDLIIIDSPQVGSPPREGEILKVTVGAFSVSYQVRWGDGRETTISPGGGTARIVRS
jgi:Domain of unknown function (DUF1918)